MDIQLPEEIGKSAINFFSTKVFESVIKWFRKKPTGDTGKQKDENTAEHIWYTIMNYLPGRGLLSS